MAKIFPTDNEIWMMVAENIRAEQDGKMTLLGFAGGNHINIPANAPFPVGAMLSVLFLLRDGEGSFDATYEIITPKKDRVPSATLPKVIKKPQPSTHGIIINLQPFLMDSFGEYIFTLRLDDKAYARGLFVDPI